MFDFGSAQYYALLIPAVLVAITFHEFSHARVALAFGDTTAEEQGRVTLNPLAHLDPVGTVGFLIGAFGWGRPVPVNPSRLNHPRADFYVSAAGPASNLAIATVAGFALHVIPPAFLLGGGDAGRWTLEVLRMLVLINLSLGIFNLLPLFPLDGSHMVENLLPVDKAYAFKRFNESYGMIILMGLIFVGVLTAFQPLRLVLGPPIAFLYGLLVPTVYAF